LAFSSVVCTFRKECKFIAIKFWADEQVLISQFAAGQASGYLSIAISLLVLIMGMGFQVVGTTRLFRHAIRILLTDYGTIMTIVFFTAFPHFGGELGSTTLLNLPTSPSFQTTTGRGWLVNFWNLGVGYVLLAIPFAVLLTILFYMDHNISVISPSSGANTSP
jgi:hypothetical protein